MPSGRCQTKRCGTEVIAKDFRQWLLVFSLLVACSKQADLQYTGDDSKFMPPLIEVGPPSYKLFQVGETFSLPCKADTLARYEWYKDGNLSKTIGSNDGSLTIEGATLEDEGYYQCWATNDAGIAMSTVAFLQAAKFVSNLPQDTEYTVTTENGNSARLPCNCTTSIPPARITWYVCRQTQGIKGCSGGRVLLGQNNVYFITLDGDLIISSVNWQHDTTYVCEAYNPYIRRRSISNSVRLNVTHDTTPGGKLLMMPKLLYSSPDQMIALVGQTEVILRCFFTTGFHIAWKKEDSEVIAAQSERTKLSDFGHSLSIKDVLTSDDGYYTCSTNSLTGMERKTIRLSVEAPPLITKVPVDIRGPPGTSGSFTCLAIGKPMPKIRWFINDKRIEDVIDVRWRSSSADDGVLYFDDATQRGPLASVVLCNASNAHGYQLAAARLMLTDRITSRTIESFLSAPTSSIRSNGAHSMISSGTIRSASVARTRPNNSIADSQVLQSATGELVSTSLGLSGSDNEMFLSWLLSKELLIPLSVLIVVIIIITVVVVVLIKKKDKLVYRVKEKEDGLGNGDGEAVNNLNQDTEGHDSDNDSGLGDDPKSVSRAIKDAATWM